MVSTDRLLSFDAIANQEYLATDLQKHLQALHERNFHLAVLVHTQWFAQLFFLVVFHALFFAQPPNHLAHPLA